METEEDEPLTPVVTPRGGPKDTGKDDALFEAYRELGRLQTCASFSLTRECVGVEPGDPTALFSPENAWERKRKTRGSARLPFDPFRYPRAPQRRGGLLKWQAV
jgi:hypothetical protein